MDKGREEGIGKRAKQIVDIFSNINRIAIYDYCLTEKLNISQIAKKIDLSYKSTISNVDILEKGGFVKKEKETTDIGTEAFITSIAITDKILLQIYLEVREQTIKAPYKISTFLKEKGL